jgi:predicted secreted protein
MSITAAIVLYAMVWFMVFFVILALRFESQADAGSVVPGTPRSAPSTEDVGRKARVTTLYATVIWAVIAGVILSGWIGIRDFDVMGRMPPETGGDP